MVMFRPCSMALTASRTAARPASRLPRSTGTSEPMFMIRPRIGTLKSSFFTITDGRIEIRNVIRHENVGAGRIDFFESYRLHLHADNLHAGPCHPHAGVVQKADVFGQVSPGKTEQRSDRHRAGPEEQHENGAKQVRYSP